MFGLFYKFEDNEYDDLVVDVLLVASESKETLETISEDIRKYLLGLNECQRCNNWPKLEEFNLVEDQLASAGWPTFMSVREQLKLLREELNEFRENSIKEYFKNSPENILRYTSKSQSSETFIKEIEVV